MQEPIYEKHHDSPIEGLYTTDCVDFMTSTPIECVDLVVTSFRQGKPKIFNPLKEKTVRSGYEMVVFNKVADSVNRIIVWLLL
jgi:hypothetical protein